MRCHHFVAFSLLAVAWLSCEGEVNPSMNQGTEDLGPVDMTTRAGDTSDASALDSGRDIPDPKDMSTLGDILEPKDMEPTEDMTSLPDMPNLEDMTPSRAGVIAVPATGQTECWDEDGASVPCAGTGQDGEYQTGVLIPSPRFTDRGDGTVRDNLTGLIWLKQANCLGEISWLQALSASNALADGQCDLTDGSAPGDWRLPNFRELTSLIDVARSHPAISNTAGTGAWTRNDPFSRIQNHLHWTSTTVAGDPTEVWKISPFASGNFHAGRKNGPNHWTWPVRDDAQTGNAPTAVPATGQTECWDEDGASVPCAGTGQDGEHQAGVPLPSPRFTDQGDGTVRDNLTGLIWLKQANCLGEDTRAQSLSLSASLADGQCNLTDGSKPGDWRVPNVREFLSLLDVARSHPAISNTAGTGAWTRGDPFTGIQNHLHWTSTTVAGDTPRNWTVSPFASGNIYGGSKTSVRWIWPVRH